MAESFQERSAFYANAAASAHPFGGDRPGEPWHLADVVLERLRSAPRETKLSVCIAGRMMDEAAPDAWTCERGTTRWSPEQVHECEEDRGGGAANRAASCLSYRREYRPAVAR